MDPAKPKNTEPATVKTLPVGEFAAQTLPPVSAVAEPRDDRFAIRRFRQLREQDALFLTFADVESHTDLEAFVARYGDTATVEIRRDLTFRSPDGREFHIHLDPFSQHVDVLRWLDEAETMRACVHLWRLAQAKDEQGLKQLIRWVGEGDGVAIQYEGKADSFAPHNSAAQGKMEGVASSSVPPGIIASSSVHPEILNVVTPGDVIRPALFYIQRVINKRLLDSSYPQVLWRREAMSLHAVPRDILGGLWLQFGLAFTGNKEHERCAECGDWFEVSLVASRKNKRFCSDACKQSAYRKRKAKQKEADEKTSSKSRRKPGQRRKP